MKYPHPWRRLGALACTAALTLTLIPAASASGGGSRQSGGLDMDKLSRQEIAALLADNSLELPGQLFEEEPSVTAPYLAGRVTDQALQAAVDRLNALRRIAGVPDVALDSALSENAQYGAVNSFLKLIGLESLQHNWLFETATAFPSVTLTWFLFAGYTTTLVLAQLLSTDESLIEAAEIDGATRFQIDRLVMFPVVKKMIGTTVIMAATYMLQLFSMLYITTGGGPGTDTTNLPLYLYTTVKANNYGYANTIGVVIILLGFVTMTLIRKIFGMNKED